MNELKLLANSYNDAVKFRRTLKQRFGEDACEDMLFQAADVVVEATQKLLMKEFKQHMMYDWMRDHPGLGGVLGAQLVAIIGDPRRFPGQCCNHAIPGQHAHYSPAIYEVGDLCPIEAYVDGELTRCSSTMLAPREGTGVRSLWRYAALDVTEEGKTPRKRKNVQSHWNPAFRTLIDMPDVGIKAQIIRQRMQPYRGIYDVKKEQKLAESLPPYKADGIAKNVAVKALLGDFLTEWKRRVARAGFNDLRVKDAFGAPEAAIEIDANRWRAEAIA